MDKHQSKIIILGSLLVSLVVVFFVFHSKQQPSSDLSTPPPVPVARAAEPMTIDSPDGKKSLTITQNKGGVSVTYVFLITDNSDGSQKEIFTKTEAVGTSLSIPSNTFSSDNKYVFLKETNGVQTSYFIIPTTPPTDSLNNPIDVSSPFVAKYQNYVITDATGWGGPTLLIINTDKVGGGIGPSFWFDVASNSFIQLSTRFN
jgi:hypothetical protein